MVHTVCHRGLLNISADEKSRRLVAIGALRANFNTEVNEDSSEDPTSGLGTTSNLFPVLRFNWYSCLPFFLASSNPYPANILCPEKCCLLIIFK